MKSLEGEDKVLGGAYTEGRNICNLGIDMPSVHLLPRREVCTRLYTIVYTCVHRCVHTCILPRSKYVLGRAFSMLSSGPTPGASETQLRPSGTRNNSPLKHPREQNI